MSESLQFNQEKKPQHVEDVDKQNHEYNHAKSSQVEELKQKEKLDEAHIYSPAGTVSLITMSVSLTSILDL